VGKAFFKAGNMRFLMIGVSWLPYLWCSAFVGSHKNLVALRLLEKIFNERAESCFFFQERYIDCFLPLKQAALRL